MAKHKKLTKDQFNILKKIGKHNDIVGQLVDQIPEDLHKSFRFDSVENTVIFNNNKRYYYDEEGQIHRENGQAEESLADPDDLSRGNWYWRGQSFTSFEIWLSVATEDGLDPDLETWLMLKHF